MFMSKNQPHVKPSVLAKDRDSLAAIKTMRSYRPERAEIEVAHLEAAQTAMEKAEESFAEINAAWDNARDRLAAAKQAFHSVMVSARGHVLAQFGADSAEVQDVGLKRKSEYRRSGPKPGSKRKRTTVAPGG